MLQGYDTMVGENFTADLKQRITLARSAIRNPSILVIDDISLQDVVDIQSNRSLIEAFHRVMDGCTTIVFSQRLPIIQNATTICTLEVCYSGSILFHLHFLSCLTFTVLYISI
jgi:ABC-type multidrug transport system, ATPase and permease components